MTSAPNGYPAEAEALEECTKSFEELKLITDADLTKPERKLLKKFKKEEEKAAKAAEKERKAKELEAQRLAKQAANTVEVKELTLNDFETEKFGNLFIQSNKKTGRTWTTINSLSKAKEGEMVWIRCRLAKSRVQGNKMCFLNLRQSMASVQGLIMGKEMTLFAKDLMRETVVDLYAKVCTVQEPIVSCSQSDVELAVERIYCVSKSDVLPFQIDDAARSDAEFKRMMAENPEEKPVEVSQDTRLNNRVLDLRTPANQGIFRIQSGTCLLFREILTKNGFTEIHTPKMIATASEGGADVFKLDYFGGSAFLAQSPQLYKQMSLMGDMDRVFEIGPVFRSEKSFTHRHLTEFVGLDMEMCFKDHYHEVLDMLDQTFNHIFKGLNERYQEEIEAVRQQYPFEDLLFQYPCLRLKYSEAMKLLREKGPAILEEQIAQIKATTNCPETLKNKQAHLESVPKHGDSDDISTEDEKILGEVIHREYKQDFYIIDKFPSHFRPFYSMEDPEDPTYANSYDIFIRGEEVMSGAQRIHDSELLLKRAKKCGVDLGPIQGYVDAFKTGAMPHAGGGVGMERVVMLFLGLNNIRKSSLFPRDPKRITP